MWVWGLSSSMYAYESRNANTWYILNGQTCQHPNILDIFWNETEESQTTSAPLNHNITKKMGNEHKKILELEMETGKEWRISFVVCWYLVRSESNSSSLCLFCISRSHSWYIFNILWFSREHFSCVIHHNFLFFIFSSRLALIHIYIQHSCWTRADCYVDMSKYSQSFFLSLHSKNEWQKLGKENPS